MSKSLGNVVDPNDVVDKFGADTLRTYVLFMGDYGYCRTVERNRRAAAASAFSTVSASPDRYARRAEARLREL